MAEADDPISNSSIIERNHSSVSDFAGMDQRRMTDVNFSTANLKAAERGTARRLPPDLMATAPAILRRH